VAGKKNDIKGILLTELVVAFSVLGVLIGCLALGLYGYAKFNLFQQVKLQCISAAQAQLDSISATGQAVSKDDFERLWPKIDVTLEQSEGTGQWSRMKLVRAKTKGMSFNTPVNVELSRYIIIPQAQGEIQ